MITIMVACAPALKPLFTYFNKESRFKDRVSSGRSITSLFNSLMKRVGGSSSSGSSKPPADTQSSDEERAVEKINVRVLSTKDKPVAEEDRVSY